jgi:predicted RNA methylase
MDLSDDSIRKAVAQPGYRPSRADAESLFERLPSVDDDMALLMERALARLGLDSARQAIARFPPSVPPLRGRLCRLAGRVAHTTPAAELRAFLLERLDDSDAKTRRNAIIALGKLDGKDLEAALIAQYQKHPELPERRSIAASLGKLGGAPALALLDTITTDDPELRRITDEARLKLSRTLGRAGDLGRIDATRTLAPAPKIILRCREGLERLLERSLPPDMKPHVAAPGIVEARLTGPLSSLYQSHLWITVGFPLLGVKTSYSMQAVPASRRRQEADLDREAEALFHALTSDEAVRVMRGLTDGAIRYRIEWATGGHRRGLTFKCAREIAARRAELVNDPTSSLWEVVVGASGVAIELRPRGLEDPRFAWRKRHVPASSHPTLAAALAQVAGARKDDVVWDPFVGAGTELVERARLGPSQRLMGTDVDQEALALARENLAAAGIAVELELADARTHVPSPLPTLIITNPPMGRRVLNKHLTGALYDAFLEHAARVLAPGGRLVWISPRAESTARAAAALGLRLTYRQRIDMGGFWAELQAFAK